MNPGVFEADNKEWFINILPSFLILLEFVWLIELHNLHARYFNIC